MLPEFTTRDSKKLLEHKSITSVLDRRSSHQCAKPGVIISENIIPPVESHLQSDANQAFSMCYLLCELLEKQDEQSNIMCIDAYEPTGQKVLNIFE